MCKPSYKQQQLSVYKPGKKQQLSEHKTLNLVANSGCLYSYLILIPAAIYAQGRDTRLRIAPVCTQTWCNLLAKQAHIPMPNIR